MTKPQAITYSQPPQILLPWLEYKAPLTDKLYHATGDATLKVISHAWCVPTWWDKFMLGLVTVDIKQSILRREILMSSGTIPCWYARTIIPPSTYKAHADRFARLEKESLREIIFSTPGVKRKHMVYYPIDIHNIEYYWISPYLSLHSEQIWARLSTFVLDHESQGLQEVEFYLVEIFLPGLLQVIHR